MGGTMGLAWLPALLAVALIVAGVVLAARMFAPGAPQQSASIGHIIVTALAIIGGVALVVALAMGTMHLGMRCC
jgi:bacteriorhodopsin